MIEEIMRPLPHPFAALLLTAGLLAAPGPAHADPEECNGIDTDTGPPIGMTNVLATGAGGCRCSASTGSAPSGLIAMLL